MLLSSLRDPNGMATSPLAIALALIGALAAAFALYAWPRKGTPGARPFSVMNMPAALLAWTYAAHFQTGAQSGDVWIRLRFAAQAYMPLAILALCFELSGRRPWAAGRWRAVLLTFPACLVAIGWTNPWHHLFLHAATPRAGGGPGAALGSAAGPALWLFIIYGVVCISSGILHLLDQALRRGGVGRTQALILLFGLPVPLLATLVSLPGALGGGVLLGPFAYAITLPIFAFAIFRFGFLDLVPVARAAVFEDMSQGVLVAAG